MSVAFVSAASIPSQPSPRQLSRQRAIKRFRWSILGPLIALLAFVLMPVLFLQLYFSFHQWTVYLGSWWDAEYVGLDLFWEVLTDPLARTEWTKFYLDPAQLTMSTAAQISDSSVTYAGFGCGVTFLTEPLEHEVEITGPIAAKLWVSSATQDADLFLVVRAFTPDLKEVTFQGALDSHTPIAQGWLRCSHRKLDEKLTLPYRPYHTHDEEQKLVPGQVYEVDVEVWPTCIVLPRGYRLALSVRGTDYVFPGEPAAGLATLGKVWTGVGPFTHNDPRDRPPTVFGADVTLHVGPHRQAHVLLPVIPMK